VRRRLMVCYAVLLSAVLAGLVLPLATSTIMRDTQATVIDRMNDTVRFASLAEPALRTGRTAALTMELRQYHSLYGIDVLIVNRDGVPFLSVGGGLGLAHAALQRRVTQALSGDLGGIDKPDWPWDSGPIVVAEPVDRDGDIIGGVLTSSPPDALHVAGLHTLLVLVGASLLVLLAGIALGQPLTRWILRPVHDLDAIAAALPAGRLPAPVAGRFSGPPELRRVVDSFNAMAGRVLDDMQRQRSFASYAGHQLRSPLASLRIALDNLAPAAGVSDVSHEIAVLEAERSAAIIDALLDYARANVLVVDTVVVDAVAAARSLVSARQPVARLADVALTCSGAGPLLVRAAPTVLDQAVDALVDNAVKYGGKGAQVRVHVGRADPDRVEVTVADDGVGIPADELHRAVEPFWRQAPHGPHDGAGLGLSIVDALVRSSGGELLIRPGEPRGLTVVVRLPAAEEAET
jgi:signal transduction histidine kinase